MEKAILAGPFIGELGWQVLRFAPFVIWNKISKYKNKVKLIVYTREDTFDLYGQYSDIFVPLRIDGDFTKYKGNCFRLEGYPLTGYYKLITNFHDKYMNQYDIVEHLYPKIEKPHHLNKHQFPRGKMIHEFKPRKDNLIIVNKYISNGKKNVVLGSRFRRGFKRNWKYWNEFYDLLYQSDLYNRFNFIICGKAPEYIPDSKERFLDINNFKLTKDSSLIGITIECIKNSILTCGSQSSIPNLSLSLGTEVLEWGDQKRFHTLDYNYKKTPITFIDDRYYNIPPEKVLKIMSKILRNK